MYLINNSYKSNDETITESEDDEVTCKVELSQVCFRILYFNTKSRRKFYLPSEDYRYVDGINYFKHYCIVDEGNKKLFFEKSRGLK